MNKTLFPSSSTTKQSFPNFLKPSLKCKSLSTVKQLVQQIDDYHHKRRHHSQKSKQTFVDRQQVRKAMKQKWKDPGYGNVEFSNYKALKGAFLNEWQIQRICLADRSFMTPKDFNGYKLCSQSKQFPKLTKDLYSQKFQKHLQKIQEKNENQLFNPKKKMHTQTAVTSNRQKTLLGKQKRTFQAFTTQNRPFGLGTVIWKSGSNIKLKTTID